jgi:hypothetical protein
MSSHPVPTSSFLPVSFSSPSLVQFFSSSPPCSTTSFVPSVPSGASRSSRSRAPEAARAHRLQRKAELARISRRKKRNHLIDLESRAKVLTREISAIEAGLSNLLNNSHLSSADSFVSASSSSSSTYFPHLLLCSLSDSLGEFSALSDQVEAGSFVSSFIECLLTDEQKESFINAIKSLQGMKSEFEEIESSLSSLAPLLDRLNQQGKTLNSLSINCLNTQQIRLLSLAVAKLDQNLSTLSSTSWNCDEGTRENLSRSNSSISLSHSHSQSSIYSVDYDSSSFPSVSSSSDLLHDQEESQSDSFSESDGSDHSDS